MEPVALGIDIGGTRVRTGIVTRDAKVLALTETPLPPNGDPNLLAAALAQHAREVAGQSGCKPAAVGIALPGIWDRQTGVMERAVNLPKLEGVNIRRLFTEALGRPVHLEIDVNAALWAQWGCLAPRPQRMVYLSLGTGVGGGVILDGRIVQHTRGGAGHLGFLIVDTAPDAPVDQAGLRGSLSAIASSPALHQAAAACGGAGGDEAALPAPVIERAARALAIALSQVAHIYAPDTIALGGGVIDHHPELVDAARAALAGYRSSLIPRELRVVQALLSTREAGVIGAGLLALEEVVSGEPGRN